MLRCVVVFKEWRYVIKYLGNLRYPLQLCDSEHLALVATGYNRVQPMAVHVQETIHVHVAASSADSNPLS